MMVRQRTQERIGNMPMEYLKGTFRCDFCHQLSDKIAKLVLEDEIYNPCPDCLEKIEEALKKWYRWTNLPADMLARDLSDKSE